MIKVTAQLIEKYLRREGDNPDSPRCCVVAPTGAAASIVNGDTLHHVFNFQFGNEYFSYPDRLRDKRRDQLKNLEFVVIDEMSMMKSDQLYQLDQRLKELKPDKDTYDFGGVSVFLLGDITQLPPVRGNYIFDVPRSHTFESGHAWSPLWRKFSVVDLVTNHRQGDDRRWATLLNNVRIGNPSDDDIELLKSRIRPLNHPDIPSDAMYVAATKKIVEEINTERLDGLETEGYSIDSININASCKTFTPKIKDGRVGDTAFMNKLDIKENARVMMIHNVDVSDHLNNGTLGEVVGFEKNSKGDVSVVYTHFYEEKAGRNLRKCNSDDVNTRYQNKRPTPVKKVEYQYSLSKESYKSHGGATAKLIQFPLMLAFAATGHKFQGATIKKPMKLVADFTKLFTPSQAYVMLSRVQDKSQIFIIVDKKKGDEGIDKKWLKPHQDALDEMKRLHKISINNNLPSWLSPKNKATRLIFSNSRSCRSHCEDIKCSRLMKMGDLMCLSETWFTDLDDEADYVIKDYDTPHLINVGHGKGLATYRRTKHQPRFHRVSHVEEPFFQIAAYQNDDMSVLSVYRSKDAPLQNVLKATVQVLSTLKDQFEKPCIIGGDFNVCAVNDSNNPLTVGLCRLGFKQVISEATHEKGNALDHLYIRDMKKRSQIQVELQSVYWSDHDAITVMVSSQ